MIGGRRPIPFGSLRSPIAVSMDKDRDDGAGFSSGGDRSSLTSLLLLVLGFPKCWARNDELASIGVKILCVTADGRGRGCGSGGLWNS